MPHIPPQALQRILAATDLSSGSARASRRAARLALAAQGRLRLLHVMSNNLLEELHAWFQSEQRWRDTLHQQTLNALNTEARALTQAFGVEVESSVADGQPVQAISAAVTEWQADLLVVGARGENPLHHLLIGTTAERLLSKASKPLLLVRSEPDQAYGRVLVPLDFSVWSETAITLAQAVAPGAHLVLMHSFSIPFEEKLRFAGVDEDTLSHYREHARQSARDHLHALVDRHGLEPDDFTLCLTEGDAPMHILSVAGDRDCDLIVIGKHGRHSTEELLLGSVTRHVLGEANCDVLVSTHRS